jgi:hypothetical protein
VQEVRLDKRGTERGGDYIIFLWKRKRKSSIGNRICVNYRIDSAIKTVEFVSGMVTFIVLRGHWCNIIFLNVHAPSEEKSDDSKKVFICI